MKGIARRALIFGVFGQDGALLARYLGADGYEVHGTSRRADAAGGNLRALGIEDHVRLHTVDPTDRTQVAEVLGAVQPFEVYNLSGQSSVGLSFMQPRETFDSHLGSTRAILDGIRAHALDCRFFHASSGEVFGETSAAGADEHAAFAPRSPYGEAKAAATALVKSYRETFGLFACSAFLFNHESVLRPDNFVTQRIVRGAVDIHLKRAGELALGRLDITRDWGWAPDYVECMARLLQQDDPIDTVVATGVPSSLEAFVARVFARFGLDWKQHVRFDATRARASDIGFSVGNPRAAAQRLGWRAKVHMPEVADRLADAALARARS